MPPSLHAKQLTEELLDTPGTVGIKILLLLFNWEKGDTNRSTATDVAFITFLQDLPEILTEEVTDLLRCEFYSSLEIVEGRRRIKANYSTVIKNLKSKDTIESTVLYIEKFFKFIEVPFQINALNKPKEDRPWQISLDKLYSKGKNGHLTMTNYLNCRYLEIIKELERYFYKKDIESFARTLAEVSDLTSNNKIYNEFCEFLRLNYTFTKKTVNEVMIASSATYELRQMIEETLLNSGLWKTSESLNLDLLSKRLKIYIQTPLDIVNAYSAEG